LVKVADGKILRVWNVPSSGGGYLVSPSFAANGIHILAGRQDYYTTTKFGAITSVGTEWYSISNALPLYRQIGEYHRYVTAAGVSPNGIYYAVGSEDGTLYLARSPIYPWTIKATPAISGGGLTLNWSVDLAGFVLQSATTLVNGGDWQDSSLTPTEANGQKSVTVPPTGPRGFYRLRGP